MCRHREGVGVAIGEAGDGNRARRAARRLAAVGRSGGVGGGHREVIDSRALARARREDDRSLAVARRGADARRGVRHIRRDHRRGGSRGRGVTDEVGCLDGEGVRGAVGETRDRATRGCRGAGLRPWRRGHRVAGDGRAAGAGVRRGCPAHRRLTAARSGIDARRGVRFAQNSQRYRSSRAVRCLVRRVDDERNHVVDGRARRRFDSCDGEILPLESDVGLR